MNFLVYTSLLALMFSLSTSTACALDFGDRDGEGRNILIGNAMIPVTIHGEWTHSSRPPPPSSQDCTSVGTPTDAERKLWYTSRSNIDPTPSNRFWIHECGEHRAPGERGSVFKPRVLRTCTAFEGYIGKMWCRIDRPNGRNVVQQILLYQVQVPHISKPTCDSNLPFFTPFDLQIMTTRGITHQFDLNTNTYTRKDIGATPPVTIRYSCPKK
ncbi:hypothetical protein RF11_04616 [Thelohanellus kitauei]|uniref:Uncharacterized protein n=1 Tax=Thelohanellus kitauei TaxID=669202 RepID=A0A0C2MW43_THEKT|nr:hypothetical protein RF11_04616 [Thelohanellus kitauei]